MIKIVNNFSCFQDKTFGLKNKKGAKQQKFVQQIKHQVATSGDPERRKVSFDDLIEVVAGGRIYAHYTQVQSVKIYFYLNLK